MEYRKLGRSGLKVSPLCLGAMMFGGPTAAATSRRIVARAREAKRLADRVTAMRDRWRFEVAPDPWTSPEPLVSVRIPTWRGHELLALIAQRDEKYPPLADDRPRNPFGFSREPDAEVAIHRDLAARDLIPVEAWRWDAAPRFDRPFADLRRERAVAHGGLAVGARARDRSRRSRRAGSRARRWRRYG